MNIRIIQWGAGINGCALIRGIIRHADLELVGCRVYSDTKHGVDAGTLAGIEPIGVLATNSREEIMAVDADVVIHCPNVHGGWTSNDEDVLELLRSGKNVISVTGAHSFPQAIPGYAEEFEAACKEGNSTFTHTGINPGMIGERLLPTLSGICTDIDTVRFKEIYNSTERTASIIEFMQFGIPLEKWTVDSPICNTFYDCFYQVLHHVAHIFNIELEDIKTNVQVVPAPEDIELNNLLSGPPILIKKGTVAGIHVTWEGVPKNKSDFRIIKENFWGISDSLPDFPATSGWDIEIEGKPSLDLKMRLVPSADGEMNRGECMVGAAIPVIPEVIAAPPGILLPKIFAPFKKHF